MNKFSEHTGRTVSARYLRVDTTAGNSYVAWFDIDIF